MKKFEYKGQLVIPNYALIKATGESVNAPRKRAYDNPETLVEGRDYFRVTPLEFKKNFGFGLTGHHAYLWTECGCVKHYYLTVRLKAKAAYKKFIAEYFGVDADNYALDVPERDKTPEEIFSSQIESPSLNIPSISTESPKVEELTPVEYASQRVITTAQVAQFYDCKEIQIIQNYNNNKDKFKEGVHLFKLEGEELKKFKSYLDEIDLPFNKYASSIILWTKRGCARHAKMLGTDKAWEVFELLEENYFNQKEKAEPARVNEVTLLNEAAELKVSILRLFPKLNEDTATAEALSKTGESHGVKLYQKYAHLLPTETKKTAYQYNARDLGKLIGERLQIIPPSAQSVNLKLLQLGFIKKNEIKNTWEPDGEGEKYGRLFTYKNSINEHAGYQVKWSLEVLDFLLPLFR